MRDTRAFLRRDSASLIRVDREGGMDPIEIVAERMRQSARNVTTDELKDIEAKALAVMAHKPALVVALAAWTMAGCPGPESTMFQAAAAMIARSEAFGVALLAAAAIQARKDLDDALAHVADLKQIVGKGDIGQVH